MFSSNNYHIFAFGQIIMLVCGFLLWIIYVQTLSSWIGPILGFFAGIIFTPGVAIFPLIYRLVEGVWPSTIYFLLFITAWMGALVSGLGLMVNKDY